MMSDPRTCLFATKQLAVDFILLEWQDAAKKAIGQKGRFVVALSGGKTPVDFYRKLSKQKFSYWNKTHIFQVDERYVAPDDADSNFRTLKRILVSKIPALAKNTYPMVSRNSSIEKDAQAYAFKMKEFFHLKEGERPCFDLILLGIGQDGHTASLFSKGPSLREKERFVTISHSSKHPHERLTLTLPVINYAKQVIFLVTGQDRADIIRRIFAGEKRLPAGYVAPQEGRLTFCIDQEAASELPFWRYFFKQGGKK